MRLMYLIPFGYVAWLVIDWIRYGDPFAAMGGTVDYSQMSALEVAGSAIPEPTLGALVASVIFLPFILIQIGRQGGRV